MLLTRRFSQDSLNKEGLSQNGLRTARLQRDSRTLRATKTNVNEKIAIQADTDSVTTIRPVMMPVDDGVQSGQRHVAHDGRHLPVVRQLREPVQHHDEEAGHQQCDVGGQVGGAGLQRFAVHGLVLAAHAHDGDLQVGERHAAEGGAQQHHGVAEAVDVVGQEALTGQLEQGGVVAERVEDDPPAARQPDAQAHQDQHQHEGRRPRRRRERRHRPAGHDGAVPQRAADGHVAVEGHDHEHRVGGAGVQVDAEGLEDAAAVADEALGAGLGEAPQDVGHHHRGPQHVVHAHVAEQQVHGLPEAPRPGDQRHQAHVGRQDEDVDQEEEDEGGNGGPGGDRQPLQDERSP
ncbi:hypothetical protein EYF80_042347 [Liparis tanakae]|uniref:Uncharacterized protein n=1 Tax=Liparis tanakae TaxID=230148 RepID=A0A4Z2G4G7_9TELE|nr:hypothetical protein EYF80_042347 [Liparis tanakae]